ncbi:MAG: type II secretion system inner membrane protein GspF [Deltaproteobacteria bacterium]|nr:type II secretion system inner membrane protein GspF [Deltaproteobacteria bacterium]
MPVYEYTALNRAGKNVKGIIDADSVLAARQALRGSGVFPVQVKETSSTLREAPFHLNSVGTLFRRVKPGELSAATRQLATLLSAGLSLVESLNALISQATNPLLKKNMIQIKESVNQGNSLAFSLSQHPKVFSQVYISMVRAGEASGSLDLVLERLAEYSEHQEALRGRIRAAMAYPVIMFVIGTVILFLLIAFIVPNITIVFREMDQTLPLPTVVLIGVSNFLKSYWWLVLSGLLGCIALVKKSAKSRKGQYVWDKIKLRMPVFGSINGKMAISRFGRTLGSLLQSGVPLLSGLEIVRNIVNNGLIARAIDDAIVQLEEGESLATPLSRSPWFPPIAVQMISVGEKSGELQNMLDKIADIYERETESKVIALTSMLEPIMILAMGLAVGFIVVSILFPIFEMNQMIR